MPIQIHTVVSDPFAENSYIVWRDGGREAFVIDPGFEPEPILEFLAERNLTCIAIINTHGHVDHIAGNAAMKEAFPKAPIFVGPGDAAMLTDAVVNMSAVYGIPIVSPPADRLVKEGDRLDLAGIALEVFDIPGHSPGHVVYLIREMHPFTVLGGDVLFRGSIGRTDFPGGSFEVLKAGIERVLWPLPPDTVVYPGHGPVTTTGHEKKTNPFVGG
ncbi:MAG TPA: MBL fold metallo-hydrolase [Gemmataceae bacterium]|jgi:glyoxylase-like metal-dependent hydrolase (beta-lactamase superfamily II)